MSDYGLPDVLPGLNLKKGLKLLGGNQESYLRLLLKFCKNQKSVIQDIKNYLANNDQATAQRAVHTLVGVAGNIGAESLYTAACNLEIVIRENIKDDWSGKILVAEKCFAELAASVSSIAGRLNTVNDKNHQDGAVDMEKVAALIIELKAALDGYYANSINILRSLKEAARNRLAVSEMEDIEKSLDKYDFDNARDVLQKLIIHLNIAGENNHPVVWP